MSEQEDFMPVFEENAPIVPSTGTYCAFCGDAINKDDPDTYREVASWVHGPKLDSPVLRRQTGWFAHKDCVKKVLDGQAPDQEPIF